jgi:hypothetical protein
VESSTGAVRVHRELRSQSFGTKVPKVRNWGDALHNPSKVSYIRGIRRTVEGGHLMYRRMVRQTFKLALLAALVALAVSACEGNQQVSKPQPLPEEREELRTGVYRTEEFEPSSTFRIGEGWSSFHLTP